MGISEIIYYIKVMKKVMNMNKMKGVTIDYIK